MSPRPMDLLLIGGSGVISSAVARRAVQLGHRVSVLTRGRSSRSFPHGVEQLVADVHQPFAVAQVLAGRHFDCAVSFVAYSAADVDAELAGLAGHCDQVVLLSTCSVYRKPATLPITEDHPRCSPRFEYPAGKIEAEDRFWRTTSELGLSATVVRTSHVYDHTTLPLLAGWTAVDRFRRRAPMVVHGDGSSLWNVLHARDFATAFGPLLGHPAGLGATLQVTHPRSISWDEIFTAVARAAGVSDPALVHRSSEQIGEQIDWMGLVCAEDFGHSVVYDQSRLLAAVPGWVPTVGLEDGLAETLAWLDAHPARRGVDRDLDEALDRLVGSPGVRE